MPIILTMQVVPQIKAAVKKYENDEKRSHTPRWNVDLNFIDDINRDKLKNLDDFKTAHINILEQEKLLYNIHLIVAFYRG